MIKENIIFPVGIAAISIFFIVSLLGLQLDSVSLLPSEIQAATSVSVSATVNVTVTCSTDISATVFGTLTTGSVFTSVPDATTTITCANSGGGCAMSVQDTGTSTGAISGLYASAVGAIIESPDDLMRASTTLSGTIEGFGLLASTSSAGSGATLTLGTRYNSTMIWENDIVGGASTTAQTIATANSTTSAREVKVRHKAAISASTLAGSYIDTIIYQCAAN
jgi:hypothetical protein